MMPAQTSKLSLYNRKRDFSKTPEPEGKAAPARTENLTFLVQKHAARRLHYDLRLEWGGVLWSWAVTRGPSNDPGEKRLAVRTEDHPLTYRDFEGTIQKGEYGGGTVMLWDQGTWEPLHDPDEGMREGKLHFHIAGQRMKGGWALVRMRGRSGTDNIRGRENWLLIKERDDEATDVPDALVAQFNSSVVTGRTLEAIANDNTSPQWESNRAGLDASPAENSSAKKKTSASTRKSRQPATEKPPGKASKARLLPNPDFQKPQLATLVDAAPEGEDWLHETKFDGYRCQVSLGSGGTRLYSRTGLDWTGKFGDLLPSLAALRCRNALIDGEVMAANSGTSAFSSLQDALKSGGPLLFHAFDLLIHDGADLRAQPLLERKRILETLLKDLPQDSALRYSTHIIGHGAHIVDSICRSGGEGIVSKRLDSPYRSTRTRAWLKIKCSRRQEFVVGGFSPSDKRGRPFASLLVGNYEDGALRYRGRVGSGLDEDDMATLAALFHKLKRDTSPFDKEPRAIGGRARWVEPAIVIEVDFSEFTGDGHIRHGVYLGHREDKPARTVVPEQIKPVASITRSSRNSAKDSAKDSAKSSARSGAKESAKVGHITISNADRELFTQPSITKGDLARYYEQVGPRMLKIAGNRPLSLVRCPEGPDGGCFFQKHAGKGFPDELQKIAIEESSGSHDDYLYVDRPQGFVAAVQMGTIEFHLWGSRVDNIEKPDRLVFDLDPDEGLGFEEVKTAAFLLRRQLSSLGLESTPLLTGGKGVHVCIPLRRTASWETVKIFSKTLASLLSRNEPQRFTATMSKAQRKGRIFIDWLRNERGATAVAPYSVRSRPGAPVAAPVTWAELKKLQSANAFGIADMPKRLSRPCPYLAALEEPQVLGKQAVAALQALL